MIELLSQPVFARLTATLLHFLWQGFAIAWVLCAVRWLWGVQDARSRYALALGALGLMAICPVMTFVLMDDGGLAAAHDPFDVAIPDEFAIGDPSGNPAALPAVRLMATDVPPVAPSGRAAWSTPHNLGCWRSG
jgi:hypothetical protein